MHGPWNYCNCGVLIFLNVGFRLAKFLVDLKLFGSKICVNVVCVVMVECVDGGVCCTSEMQTFCATHN